MNYTTNALAGQTWPSASVFLPSCQSYFTEGWESEGRNIKQNNSGVFGHSIQFIGIDKLKLYFAPRSFKITDGNHLIKVTAQEVKRKQPTAVDQLLYIDREGNACRARRAYWNGQYIHALIRPIRDGLIGLNNIALLVIFSPAKIVGDGDNLKAITKGQLRQVLTWVEDQLEKAGIKVDVLTATISRLDLFRNLTLQHPTHEYLAVVRYISISRTQAFDYQTGHCWRNKSAATTVYDKIAERQNKGLPTAHLPQHILRLEEVLHAGQTVRRTLGSNSIAYLLDSFDSLNDILTQRLRKRLFRYAGSPSKAKSRKAATLEAECLDLYNRDGYAGLLRRAIEETKNAKRKSDRLQVLSQALLRALMAQPHFAERYIELENKALFNLS